MLAAGDTFRAAAIEQLRIWGERANAPVIAREPGADAAGLAFDAIKAAQEQNIDILLMDTAGRLQNRTELMDELEKIVRVMKRSIRKRLMPCCWCSTPRSARNGIESGRDFWQGGGVTGLVMTKLDGTARGGYWSRSPKNSACRCISIGVGEQADDIWSHLPPAISPAPLPVSIPKTIDRIFHDAGQRTQKNQSATQTGAGNGPPGPVFSSPIQTRSIQAGWSAAFCRKICRRKKSPC